MSPCLPVSVLGLSMGGAAAILAAAAEPRIAAVVADSVFPSLAQAIERRVLLSFGLFAGAAQPTAKQVWRFLHGLDPATVAPERAIAAISPRPVLVIHCGLDLYLSESHARTLFDAAGEPREFWRVEAALHARAHVTYPDAYVDRVLEFLHRYGL